MLETASKTDTNPRFHPSRIIFSTAGAFLVLFIGYKLKIHFPAVE